MCFVFFCLFVLFFCFVFLDDEEKTRPGKIYLPGKEFCTEECTEGHWDRSVGEWSAFGSGCDLAVGEFEHCMGLFSVSLL